jgi:uncharacterized membrane protein YqhA
MRKIISATRYLILIAVIGAFLAAVAVMLYAGYETVQILTRLLSGELALRAGKALAIKMIEVIDLYLIGTVFYIFALGLYELFIDDQVPTPEWLHITHLNDLKGKLLGVAVVIMAVLFLGHLVSWDGGADIFRLGAAIALMIAAITLYMRFGQEHKD